MLMLHNQREELSMPVRGTSLLASASLVVVALAVSAPARAEGVDFDRVLNAEKNPNDWLTYHGSFKGWHYSPLTEINTDNVKDLGVAWIHQPGRSTRGVQSMPLAADGRLYYS